MNLVGNKLRDLRIKKHMTQEQVSKVLGITQQIYSNYETNKNELPVRHLITLANFYEVSTDYLLGRVSYPKTPPELARPFIQNITTSDFIRRVSSFNEPSKYRLVEYVNYLIYLENKHKRKQEPPL